MKFIVGNNSWLELIYLGVMSSAPIHNGLAACYRCFHVCFSVLAISLLISLVTSWFLTIFTNRKCFYYSLAIQIDTVSKYYNPFSAFDIYGLEFLESCWTDYDDIWQTFVSIRINYNICNSKVHCCKLFQERITSL